MSPVKLTKTLAFLKLHPRRLVQQGLAPKALLSRMNAQETANKNKGKGVTQRVGAGKENNGNENSNNEDFAEAFTANMELTNEEDNKKEWNDGFMPVVESAAANPATAPSFAEDNDSDAAASAIKKNNHPLHEAFLAGGIQLRLREVRPLLLALGIRPRRLVKLGKVDAKYLPAMLQAENKAIGRPQLHQLQRRMTRAGGPCGDGPRGLVMGGGARRGGGGGVCGRRVPGTAPGAGGKICSPSHGNGRARSEKGGRKFGGGGGGGAQSRVPMVMMMRRRLHPAARLPLPPPPPTLVKGEGHGMLFVPVNAPSAGGRGRGRGPPGMVMRICQIRGSNRSVGHQQQQQHGH